MLGHGGGGRRGRAARDLRAYRCSYSHSQRIADKYPICLSNCKGNRCALVCAKRASLGKPNKRSRRSAYGRSNGDSNVSAVSCSNYNTDDCQADATADCYPLDSSHGVVVLSLYAANAEADSPNGDSNVCSDASPYVCRHLSDLRGLGHSSCDDQLLHLRRDCERWPDLHGKHV